MLSGLFQILLPPFDTCDLTVLQLLLYFYVFVPIYSATRWNFAYRIPAYEVLSD